jgi:hypothetical protein
MPLTNKKLSPSNTLTQYLKKFNFEFMRYLLLILLGISFSAFSQPLDSIPEKEKHSYDIYIKTEILNSLGHLLFIRPTYDLDLQLGIRIKDNIHFVATYGQSDYYFKETVPSPGRFKVSQFNENKGVAFNRTSLMLRYFPFDETKSWRDYMFVEGGIFFTHSKGIANSNVYDSIKSDYEYKYHQEIDFYRYGPEINLGFSYRYNNNRDYDINFKRPRIIFSPEIFIGIGYNNISIINYKTEFETGSTPIEPYTETKIKFMMRAKIGLGFDL